MVILAPAIRLDTEIELVVIAVADAGDGPVRYGGPVRAVEQAADFVGDTVDTAVLPCGMASEFCHPGQGLPYRTVPPQFPTGVPQGIVVKFHSTISSIQILRDRNIL